MRDYHQAFKVRLRVQPNLFERMPLYFGDRVLTVVDRTETQDAAARVTCELRFGSHEEARAQLLRFGSAVEVIEPSALRYSIRDYAEQIISVYAANSE